MLNQNHVHICTFLDFGELMVLWPIPDRTFWITHFVYLFKTVWYRHWAVTSFGPTS